MKIDSLLVSVPERPVLGHARGSISFLPSSLSIWRLEHENRISNQGAHLQLILPAAILLDCFGRRMSTFNFEGPYLGELTERHGLADYEYGGFMQHAVTGIQMRSNVDIDEGIFQLVLAGALSPMQQSIDNWGIPKPLTEFAVEVAFPIAEAGLVFHGKDSEMQSAVQKRLDRLVTV